MQPDHEIDFTGTCAIIRDEPYKVDPSTLADLCTIFQDAKAFFPKEVAILNPVYLQKGEAYFTLLESAINESYSFYFNAGYDPELNHGTQAKLEW